MQVTLKTKRREKMTFEYKEQRQDWEQDEIVERANELLEDIADSIESIDNLSYYGSPDEESNSFVLEDGRVEFNKGDSFVDSEGNLILKYD